MATTKGLYQRGEIWWLDYPGADGKRILVTSGTRDKEKAKELRDKLVHEVWLVKRLGSKQRHTWKEAVVRWLDEKQHKKSIKTDIIRLKYLHLHFSPLYLDEITVDLVNKVKSDYLKSGVKHSTLNRMLALIRSILRAAKNEWEWLDRAPSIKLTPEPKRRVRWLKPEEIARLMAELPEHLKAMAQFSLATGLRESNVTQLKWEQVDMQRHCAWIYADQAKAGQAIPVPLNQNAIDVIRSQIGKNAVYVFTFDGKPVTRANNKAWRKALKRAGIYDFRWHDLRHTWASFHMMNGTPLSVLQELGGWESADMVRRYGHLSSQHLAAFASNANNLKLVE